MSVTEEYIKAAQADAKKKAEELIPRRRGRPLDDRQELIDRIAGSIIAARLIGYIDGQHATPRPA
jgi:hypothetical protein